MNYILSPELHRNLWLKFTPLKIAAVPLLLLLGTMIVVNASKGEMGDVALESMARTVFFGAVYLWGTYEAAGALADEIKDKTWDQQKMSAITPGQLAFGKLFGATSYTWYAGLSALCIICYTHSSTQHDKSLAYMLASMIAAGVFGQVVALLASFADLASGTRRTVRNYIPATKGPFILGLIAAHVASTAFGMKDFFGKQAAVALRTVQWYGHAYDTADFALAALLVFCGWALVGLYRITRAELMYRLTPVAWVGFVATLAVFLAGFVRKGSSGGELPYCVMFAVFLGMTYIAMLSESMDTRRYKRLARAVHEKNRLGTMTNMPKWVATLPFAVAFYVIATGVTALTAKGADTFWPVFMLMTSTLLFAVRDVIVMHVLTSRGVRFQRLLYFVLAYALLPALHGSAVAGQTSLSEVFDFMEKGAGSATAGKIHAFAWYFPSYYPDAVDTLLPAAVQVVLAAVLLRLRLKKKD